MLTDEITPLAANISSLSEQKRNEGRKVRVFLRDGRENLKAKWQGSLIGGDRQTVIRVFRVPNFHYVLYKNLWIKERYWCIEG